MNYLKRILMTFALLLSVIAAYAGGIKNATELVAFATALNKGGDLSAFKNDKGEVCLEADIDMAKVKKWTPIKEFKGIFDGRGFALKNWKTKQGIFEFVADSAEVRNLRIDASCAMTVATEGEVIAGFIAHISKGRVDNCENCAPIHYKGVRFHNLIGQLVV